MKRKSHHTKREYAEWNEHDARNYDWDDAEEEVSNEDWDGIEESEDYYAEESETVYTEDAGEYYGEEAYEAEGEYYGEEGYEAEGYEAEGEYYGEEGYEAEGEYYGEETYEAEGEYYGEEGYEAEGEYYGEEITYEAESAYYTGEIIYEAEDEYYEENNYAAKGKNGQEEDEEDEEVFGLFGLLKGRFSKMGAMDWMLTVTGVLALLLVLVTGGVYLGKGTNGGGVSALAEVGSQLEGITMIGEKGLLAVTDAEIAKQMAADIVDEDADDRENGSGYDEEEYSNAVKVKLNLTSVKKDLKIKFTNRENGKLVSNVPFSVNVAGPDGKSETWTDDDMDGIIYRKDITAGTYTVTVNELEGDKYKDYTLPVAPQTINVKKEIAYEKVDVSNEVKTESEIDASKEDTKINETVIESSLKDTVTWVESTVVAETYTEISKNTIVNPLDIVLAGHFMRTAAVQPDVNQGTGSGNEAPGGNTGTETPGGNTGTETPGGNTGTETPGGNTGTETPGGNTGTETPGGNTGTETPGGNTGTENPDGGNTGGENPGGGEVQENAAFTIQITPKDMQLAVEEEGSAKVELQGATAGVEMEYSFVVSGDAGVVTAEIDANGNITVKAVKKGNAVLAVTAGYKTGEKKPATAVVKVSVVEKPVIELEKAEAQVYLAEPLELKITVPEGTNWENLRAETSNAAIATAKIENNKLVITGVAVGDAIITVKYISNDKVLAEKPCAVKVNIHPKDNVKELLKDSQGEQVYVKQNDTYREAVYADYYTADKFFVKGDVKYTGWQTINGKVYYFTAKGEKVTGEQIIQGAKYNFASDGSLVTGSGVLGIDVSKWNGKIDWKAVKNSGVSYVIIRCGYRGSTGGSLIEDPKYAANIKGATEAGLKVGVYFFSQAIDEVEAVEEASYVLDKIKKHKISYPVFLDVEPSGGRADKIDKATRTAVCKAFCETIQRAGYTAGIYANKSWLETKIDTSKLGGYKIWLAQYAATPTYTGRYEMWQYKSTGRISGISGDVDMNLSYLGY